MPVSAHECAASAAIDAEPVRNAATVLAVASSPFATRATMTVNAESLPSSLGGRLRSRAGCWRWCWTSSSWCSWCSWSSSLSRTRSASRGLVWSVTSPSYPVRRGPHVPRRRRTSRMSTGVHRTRTVHRMLACSRAPRALARLARPSWARRPARRPRWRSRSWPGARRAAPDWPRLPRAPPPRRRRRPRRCPPSASASGSAAAKPRFQRYVALGDSYTAAPLVPDTDTTNGCLRSTNNYPALVAAALRHRAGRRQLQRRRQRLDGGLPADERGGQAAAVRRADRGHRPRHARASAATTSTCSARWSARARSSGRRTRRARRARDRYRDGASDELTGSWTTSARTWPPSSPGSATGRRKRGCSWSATRSSSRPAAPAPTLPLAAGDYPFARRVSAGMAAAVEKGGARRRSTSTCWARARGTTSAPATRGSTGPTPTPPGRCAFHPFAGEQQAAVAELVLARRCRGEPMALRMRLEASSARPAPPTEVARPASCAAPRRWRPSRRRRRAGRGRAAPGRRGTRPAPSAGRRRRRPAPRGGERLLAVPGVALVGAAVHRGRDRQPRVQRRDRRVRAERELHAVVEHPAEREAALGCAPPRSSR